jgi:hypothetical protein
MINPTPGVCLTNRCLWLRDSHPIDVGEKTKASAFTSWRELPSVKCIESRNTDIEITRCAGGYFIYKFKEALDAIGCLNWGVFVLKGL